MIFYKELLIQTYFLLLLFVSFILIEQVSASPLSPQSVYQTASPQQEQSLFDKLAPETDLSIFLELLMHNDLIFSYLNSTTSTSTSTTTITMDSLVQQNGDPVTVFCPTNQAFFDYWKTQPKKTWKHVLERHIVPQTRLDPISLKHACTLKTLLPGTTIHVKHSQPGMLLDGDTSVDIDHPIVSALSIAYKINHVLPFSQ